LRKFSKADADVELPAGLEVEQKIGADGEVGPQMTFQIDIDAVPEGPAHADEGA
jgi:hypothetical protein